MTAAIIHYYYNTSITLLVTNNYYDYTWHIRIYLLITDKVNTFWTCILYVFNTALEHINL